MGQHKPETNNEARLRDARAAEEIARIQHQGQLEQGRTIQNADTRSVTAGILTETATTDANMASHHNRFKNARVEEIHKKKEKLEKDEEQFRNLAKYSWFLFPVTLAIYCVTCCNVFLPEMMKEKKRNAQRKIKEADAELLQLTNVGVRSSYSISNSVGASDMDRRVSGTMDPPGASVYAPAPVSHVVMAPPPPYHDVGVGVVTQPHVQ